jgi:hypothetical protein
LSNNEEPKLAIAESVVRLDKKFEDLKDRIIRFETSREGQKSRISEIEEDLRRHLKDHTDWAVELRAFKAQLTVILQGLKRAEGCTQSKDRIAGAFDIVRTVYLLREDDVMNFRSRPYSTGVAVTSEEEAKAWASASIGPIPFASGNDRTYEDILIFNSVAEAMDHLKSEDHK